MSPKRKEPAETPSRAALLNVLEDLKAENEARRRSENDLRDAEARYRLLFEYSPDGIVILDPATARPMEFNETACRQLGYTREEFSRLALSDYEASETPEETASRIAGVLREGRNDFETRHRTKQGEVRDVLVTAQVTEILGRPVYHCVWRDITERKRAEARVRDSEENMRYIVKHDPNAVAIYDRDLRYIAVSDRYLQDYGLKEEDIVGKHHYEVFPEMPQRWKDVHQRCLAGAIEREDDDHFERPDGSITYNRWECRPWRRADGTIGGIITYTEVTTERKRAEKALRDSEEKFKEVFESANVGKSITLPSGEIDVNRAFAEMLGYEREELNHKKWQDLTPADEIPSIQDDLDRLLRGEADSTRFAKRYICKDGGIIWGDVSVRIRREGGGKPVHFITTVVDITERKRAEEAVQAANETLRALIGSSPLAIIALDPDGIVTLWNRAAEQMFGWSEREALGTFLPLVPDDKREEHAALRKRVLSGEGFNDVEAQRRRKDGSAIDISISTAPLHDARGRIIGIISVSADITERRRAEAELRERDLRLNKLVTWVPGMIYRFKRRPDGSYCVPFTTEAIRGIFGCSPEDVRENFAPIAGVIVPEDLERVVASIEDSAEHLTAWSCEYRVRIPGGPVRWMLGNATPERSDDGSITWYGYNMDITARKLTEDALREREQRLSNIYDTVGDVIFHLAVEPGGEFRFISINRTFSSLTGLRSEQVIGKRVSEIIPEPSLTTVLANYRRAIDERTVVSWEEVSEYPSGRLIGEVRAAPVFDDQGRCTHLVGSVHDITARKMMEDAVRASLREKEILLREIHHRVKNNMQVISSLLNLQADHVADADARRMLKEGQLRIRSMALIHEKLYQARDLSKVEFASYIQSLTAHLFKFFKVDPGQVRLESDLEDVRLDINTAVPCGLLFNELISNVLKHAFPGGRKGTVRIRLWREKDGGLKLRVADDGVGIPQALDYRRAESFGLQIVDLLIGQIEGKVELDRTNGTDFTVSFRELGYKPRT